MVKVFYKSVSNSFEFEIPKIKGSSFIGSVFFVEDREQVDEKLAMLQKKHHGANHHCRAFELFDGDKSEIRYSDNGEPSGTAGKPISLVIQGSRLQNILVVITRYFGGVKLGTGGLIKAYTDCAKQTLQNAKTIEIPITKELSINANYNNINILKNLLNKYQCKITNEQYGDQINIKFLINIGDINDFNKCLQNDFSR